MTAGSSRSRKQSRVELVIVGRRSSLSGLVDRLAVGGIPAFRPTQAAARIEASKSFSQELAERHGIPRRRRWRLHQPR